MKITTIITLPEEVYQYYIAAANRLSNVTVEQLLAETLIRNTEESKSQETL